MGASWGSSGPSGLRAERSRNSRRSGALSAQYGTRGPQTKNKGAKLQNHQRSEFRADSSDLRWAPPPWRAERRSARGGPSA
eukprot:8200094-Pyramimonas_sp.AAC.1